MAYVIQNGLPAEHITPWIFPKLVLKTRLIPPDVTLQSSVYTILYEALLDGHNSPTKIATWLDDKFNEKNFLKTYFTVFSSKDGDYSPTCAWSLPGFQEYFRNLLINSFEALKTVKTVNQFEWHFLLARAVNLSVKHDITETLSDFQENIYTNKMDIYDLSSENIHNISSIMSDSFKNEVSTVADQAEELLMELMNPKKGVVPTHLPTLNDCLGGGLKNGNLYTLVSPPGGGKTTLASDIADYAASQKIPTLFIAMEMGKDQLFAACIARQGRINSSKIESPYDAIRKSVEEQVAGEADAFCSTKAKSLYIIEGDHTTSPGKIETLISTTRARFNRSEDQPMLVVIDYIQLLSTGNKELDHNVNETAKISELAVMGKQLARRNNVAVLSISDVTKQEQQNSWADKELTMNSPRGSNRIAHASDCVMGLYSEPSKAQGGKASSDPWQVYIEKFNESGSAVELVREMTDKIEDAKTGGDGATVFSRLELLKNRGGQGKGNQFMLYYRAYHKFDPVEFENQKSAEGRG